MALPHTVNQYVPQDAPGWTDQDPGNFTKGDQGINPDVNSKVLTSAIDSVSNVPSTANGWTVQTDSLNATA